MEETKTDHAGQDALLELLKKIESQNAAQERYARKQHQMARISAIASILVLAVVILCAGVLMPRLLRTFDQIDTVMGDLEVVSSELSQSVPGLIKDLNTLVNTSSEEISQAIEKVSSIDIDSLNEAIQDLQTIIAPLSRIFGK